MKALIGLPHLATKIKFFIKGNQMQVGLDYSLRVGRTSTKYTFAKFPYSYLNSTFDYFSTVL